MPDPEVKINVRTTEAGGNSGLGKVKSELGQLLGSIPGVSAGLGAVGTGAGIVATAFATAAKAIHEFAQAEQGIAKLDAALANFGQLNEQNRQSLQGLAASLQDTTAIADDEWIGVLTKLVQFGAKPETIGMDVEAVKNLAGVVGDVGTATTLYSRALQGNFEMLGRYGIKVKDLGELQRVAAERGGGQLEANARSMSGLFSRAANSASDFFEALGQGIARTGFVQSVLGSLSDVMSGLAERFGSAYGSLQSYNRETSGAAEAISRYREQGQQVLEMTKRHVDLLQEESKLLERKQQILDTLTDKEEAMKIAQVDLAVAEGRMTSKDATKAKAGIRYDVAREKIERQRSRETEQLRLQEEAVQAMEQRKAAVDADLAREKAKVAPEERLAKIRQLILSAAQSRQEYTAQAKFALGEFYGDRAGADKWVADVNGSTAQMRDWEKTMLARTENSSSVRRARIQTLEAMSDELGGNLASGKANLAERRVLARASAAGGNLDLATAKMTQLQGEAQGSNSKLDGAARGVVYALRANADLSTALLRQVDDIRREISQLHAQAKNAANK